MQTHGPTFYVNTLIALLTSPGPFFATRFEQVTTFQALGILTISGLFFATTGALLKPESASLAVGLILFINAMGMVAMSAGIGYLVLAATAGRRYPFAQLFTVFALSSGAVLLIAWVPSAFILTEPWKWWLIGTGMVNALGMSKARAAITVMFTFGSIVIIIYSLMPIVQQGAVHPI